MKKILLVFIIITSIVFVYGCSNKRNENELKLGEYVEVENGLSWVILKINNEFYFNRHIATSYDPSGSYSIKDGELILKVRDNEEYRFKIDGEKLVFESGTHIGDLLKKGAVFKLSNKN